LGIIILSQHLHFDIVALAIANGVRGYLLKSDDVSLALPEAIKQVCQGRVFFSVAVSQEVLHPADMPVNETITFRQRQIILTVAKSPDTPYSELADQMGISYRTFKGHLEGAYKTLAVSNVTACIIRSMQLGLIPFMPNEKGISFGNL
jgi:DNA-binding NarL/FixJ family response regulator